MDLRAIYFTCIICPKPSLTSDLGTKKGAMIELRRERASAALAMWRERESPPRNSSDGRCEVDVIPSCMWTRVGSGKPQPDLSFVCN